VEIHVLKSQIYQCVVGNLQFFKLFCNKKVTIHKFRIRGSNSEHKELLCCVYTLRYIGFFIFLFFYYYWCIRACRKFKSSKQDQFLYIFEQSSLLWK